MFAGIDVDPFLQLLAAAIRLWYRCSTGCVATYEAWLLKQLQRLFTHNTKGWSVTGFCIDPTVTLEDPAVLLIFGRRLVVQVWMVAATLVCLCVICHGHHLNFHACALSPSPHGFHKHLCWVWDCFVDLLADKEVTISLNTCLTSTFARGKMCFWARYEDPQLFFRCLLRLDGILPGSFALNYKSIVRRQAFQPQTGHRHMQMAPVVLCTIKLMCLSTRGKTCVPGD